MSKILHYSPRFYPLLGGIETHVDTIVRNLPKYQFEVLARGLSNEPTYVKYLQNTSIRRFYPLDYWTSPPTTNMPWKVKLLHNAWADYSRTVRINRYIENSEFDLLHVHEIDIWNLLRLDILLRSNVFTKLADKLFNYSNTKRPVLLTKHYLHNGANSPRKFNEFENKFIEKFSDIICVDRHIYEYINENWDNKNIWYIPNSIDTEKFNFTQLPNEEKLNLGFIGRLDATKGIKIIKELVAKLPPYVRMHLVLSGNEKDIKYFSKTLDLAKNDVIIYSNVQNHLIPTILKNINILFNPVLIPSISRVTIEAMSCGRPVIMYNYGDRYPLVHKKNGFIIDKDANELLELLNYLNENRDLLETMGREARSVIKSEFSNEKKIVELNNIYKSLIESR